MATAEGFNEDVSLTTVIQGSSVLMDLAVYDGPRVITPAS